MFKYINIHENKPNYKVSQFKVIMIDVEPRCKRSLMTDKFHSEPVIVLIPSLVSFIFGIPESESSEQGNPWQAIGRRFGKSVPPVIFNFLNQLCYYCLDFVITAPTRTPIPKIKKIIAKVS